MKVSELIQELQKFPQNLEVQKQINDIEYEWYSLIYQVSLEIPPGSKDQVVIIN